MTVRNTTSQDVHVYLEDTWPSDKLDYNGRSLETTDNNIAVNGDLSG